MALYLVSFVISLFGGDPVHQRASPFGILFSVFVCGLAAINLALDFDFIERGTKAGLAKDYEWVAAVGLLVTIVWLYLEILRLLASCARTDADRVGERAAVGGGAARRRGVVARRPRLAGCGRRRGQRRDLRCARHVRLAPPAACSAFVLDSTWAVPMTAAALVTHAVAAVQRGRGGYLAELSRRANRHVYARGFGSAAGFLVTIGNTVHGAGGGGAESPRGGGWSPTTRTSTCGRRAGSARCTPSCTAAGWSSAAPSAPCCGRRAPGRAVGRVVETCAYYLNPFEWWAYSSDGHGRRQEGRRPRLVQGRACGR